VTLQSILTATGRLESEIAALSAADPELATVVAEIEELQRELARVRSAQGPLVPDAGRELSSDERSAQGLEQALKSLLAAANSKRETLPST
jgi:hypothetical protein